VLKAIMIVGIGGALGSVSRFLAQRGAEQLFATSFPLGTFLVNIIGSFIIGVAYTLAERGGILTYESRLFIMVGFCGGFTTFSSFSSENLMLMQNGQVFTVLIYTSLSILLGFLAVYLGYIFTNLL
jgi:CrcB protein